MNLPDRFRPGRLGIAAATCAALLGAAPPDGDGVAPAKDAPAIVELAICLDTSGSMDGLLDAARQKLWAIVNDLALAEPTPELRVALLTFGNDGHAAESGWVRVDCDFTQDLDRVSEQLFALTTNGGTELVGRVLKAAGEQLSWEPRSDGLKIVIVAGNESAEQDAAVDFRGVCRAFIERGTVVNSIYCGDPADELAPAWREVARHADGHFASINQENGTIVVATPFDAELTALSAAINATFLAYGADGFAAAENQWRQDRNAEACNTSTAAQRAMTKGGKLYACSWDLVDAVKTGDVKLSDVKKEDLPENLREKSIEERQKCIDEAWAKRQEVQQKIQAVGQKREQFVADEMKKLNQSDDDAFDRAVRDALRKQAEAKGLRFPDPKTPAGERPLARPVKPSEIE